MTDSPTRIWMYAVIAGIISIFLFLLMAGIMPKGAPTMSASYGSPVLALEYARTLPDVRAILGTTDDPALIARISMLQLGTWQDMVFAPAYGAFLGFCGIALLRVTDWRALYAVPILGAIAVLSDLLENWMLLDVLDAYRTGGMSVWLAKLGWPVNMKFLCLGISGAILGIGLAAVDGIWKPLGYAVAIASFPLTLITLIVPQWTAGAMAAGIGIGWIIIFIAACRGTYVWVRNR